MVEQLSLATLVWSALVMLVGILVGTYWSELRRSQRSQALTRTTEQLHALDTKADHFGFGIADLELRIQAANNEIAMVREDLKLRRVTYDRLNHQLQSRWEEALACKRELAVHERNAEDLRHELSNWKGRLDDLYQRSEASKISNRALKRELAGGLSAIFTEAGDELPAMQRLLLQNTIEIGLGDQYGGEYAGKGYHQILELLTARIEMLENQVTYWQERADGMLDGGLPEPAQQPFAASNELQHWLPFEEFNSVKPALTQPLRSASG